MPHPPCTQTHTHAHNARTQRTRRYKGVCLSCKTSIARGTRYNASKVDTGESYFTTRIWEFRLSCRICSHPFRIRTDPRDRGFDYVEGIKIQAGQEPSKELLDCTFATNMNVPDALAKLEASARSESDLLTEIDRLQRLKEINDRTSFDDADSNANVRKRFRKDRNEKRARARDARRLGWRDGMEVVGSSLDDRVAARETVFGRSKVTERERFGAVKRTSIFAANPAAAAGGTGATSRRNRSRRRGRASSSSETTTTAAGGADDPRADRAPGSGDVPLCVPSSGGGGVPILRAAAGGDRRTAEPDEPAAAAAAATGKFRRKIDPAARNGNPAGAPREPPPASFSSMLAGYGSSCSDED